MVLLTWLNLSMCLIAWFRAGAPRTLREGAVGRGMRSAKAHTAQVVMAWFKTLSFQQAKTLKKPKVFEVVWKDHHSSKFKAIGGARWQYGLDINQKKNRIRKNKKIMRYRKMSKLIRGDFSYPDTQEQGHNERNKSSNSHVLYPQRIKRWQKKTKVLTFNSAAVRRQRWRTH